MYNGIGLATARGSATSGHVTKNLSYVKPEFFRHKVVQNNNGNLPSQLSDQSGNSLDTPFQKVHEDIVDHKKKRELEAQLYEFKEGLLEKGLSEEEIEEEVARYHRRLVDNRGKNNFAGAIVRKNADSHDLSLRKEDELVRVKKAFRINDSFKEGESFNKESQKQRKLELEEKSGDRPRNNPFDDDRMVNSSYEEKQLARRRSLEERRDREREHDRERDRDRDRDRGRDREDYRRHHRDDSRDRNKSTSTSTSNQEDQRRHRRDKDERNEIDEKKSS